MTISVLDKSLAKEDFSRLLAACYYQPEAHLVEEEVFASLVRAAELLDPALVDTARQLGSSFAAESLSELLLDYSRLFLGPIEILAKPYGSVWMEGEKVIMGDSTMAVLDLYREGGFTLDDDFREVPDHIAAELEFLYLLNFQHSEAEREGQAEAHAQAAEVKQRLLRNHLGRWVGPFTAAMTASAGTSFYRVLAELTARYLQFELQEGQG